MAFEPNDALLHAYRTNDRINEYLLRNVPMEAWRVKPPGGKGRVIADIAAHMHNVRLMWLKAAAKDVKLPAKLDGDSFSPDDVVKALAQSCDAMYGVLAASLESGGKIKGFKPDVGSFFAYLIAHDAHHRGQITQLARQSGHAVSQSVNFGMWEWGNR